MGTTPHDLAAMDEQKAVVFLREFVVRLEGRDVSGVTIRTYIKAIKSWWTFNDLEVTRRVRVKDSAGRYDNERVPTREELQRILDVCSMRERLSVSLMAFCGFRPQGPRRLTEGTTGLSLETCRSSRPPVGAWSSPGCRRC